MYFSVNISFGSYVISSVSLLRHFNLSIHLITSLSIFIIADLKSLADNINIHVLLVLVSIDRLLLYGLRFFWFFFLMSKFLLYLVLFDNILWDLGLYLNHMEIVIFCFLQAINLICFRLQVITSLLWTVVFILVLSYVCATYWLFWYKRVVQFSKYLICYLIPAQHTAFWSDPRSLLTTLLGHLPEVSSPLFPW